MVSIFEFFANVSRVLIFFKTRATIVNMFEFFVDVS